MDWETALKVKNLLQLSLEVLQLTKLTPEYGGLMYPITPKYAHSGMIYNLGSFKGQRNQYGYAADGAWGILNRKRVWGKDLWAGNVDPTKIEILQDGVDPNNGVWHGAVDWIATDPIVKSAFDGVVRKASEEIVIIESSGKQTFLMFYQHIRPRISEGTKVKTGDVIGKICVDEAHLHLECLSKFDLWDYTRIKKEEAQEYFWHYGKHPARPRSQFSRKYTLFPLGLEYPLYCYNAIKFIEHFYKMEIQRKPV